MRVFPAAVTLALAGSVFAYDPANGDWSKDDPAHLRFMTWNVEDGICSTATKTDAFNAWNALARIVAAVKPDVLVLQETADNSANGDVSGGSIDSVVTMENVIELFVHGGADPYRGGTVGSYVQKWDPSVDFPYVAVSATDDGFNRNIVLSRYPFADINGSGVSVTNTWFSIADAYSDGGGPGIRGFQWCEIDLPDEVYAGDVVAGNAHLKAGGSSSDREDRLTAAINIAYYIDYHYNGAGTGVSDPNNRIFSAQPSQILDPEDAIIWGGDWNEDEASNGRKGPAEWMTRAQTTGGTDGTDADRSDSVYDNASEFFTGNTDTRGSSKLDYVAWQDSRATAVHQVVVRTNTIQNDAYPAELASFTVPSLLAGIAADHFPVWVDFELPLAEANPCVGDINGSGTVDSGDLAELLAAWGSGDGGSDLDGSGSVDSGDLAVLLASWGPCPE